MPITAADQQLALHNLQTPDVIADPVPYYTRLHTTAPVYFDPFISTWLLSRHADVQHVLAHPDTMVQMRHTDTLTRFVGAGLEDAFRLLDLHVSFVDDPQHRRLRRPAPTRPGPPGPHRTDRPDRRGSRRRVRWPRRQHPREPVDVVTALAAEVPIRVTRHLLGMHDVDIPTIQRWSHAWGDITSPRPGTCPPATATNSCAPSPTSSPT